MVVVLGVVAVAWGAVVVPTQVHLTKTYDIICMHRCIMKFLQCRLIIFTAKIMHSSLIVTLRSQLLASL